MIVQPLHATPAAPALRLHIGRLAIDSAALHGMKPGELQRRVAARLHSQLSGPAIEAPRGAPFDLADTIARAVAEQVRPAWQRAGGG